MDTKVAGYAERPWHMLIGAADVDDAVAAARKAARPWARTPIAERAAALNALAGTQHKNVHISY